MIEPSRFLVVGEMAGYAGSVEADETAGGGARVAAIAIGGGVSPQ